MEKIFKKSLALVLSAALCLTALVGCLTVSAADETTPTYAISTDAKGKVGDTVEVIAEYTNISTVCGHYVTVTFPANFTVKEVYQAKESADGETYKLLTAYKEGSEENWQYKMDVVEGKTAIKSCDIINFFASEGSEHNVTTGSLKFKFVVTIGEVEVGEYPVTIAVEAASQDEMWITPVITNGKITVEANTPACDHANKEFYTDDEHMYVPATGTSSAETSKGKIYFKCNDCNEIIEEETSYHHVYATAVTNLGLESETLAKFYLREDHYKSAETPTDAIIVLKKNNPNGEFTLKVTHYNDATDTTVKLGSQSISAKLVSLGIKAKEMNDAIVSNVFVLCGDKWYNGLTITKSVKTFAMTSIKSATSNSNPIELKKLYANMLEYGAKAQVYFNYDTENLANSELADYRDLVNTTIPSIEDKSTNNLLGNLNHVGFHAFSLYLGDKVAMNIGFRTDFYKGDEPLGSIIAKASYTSNSGNIAEWQTSDYTLMTGYSDRYIFRYDEIAAKDMRKLVTFQLNNENGAIGYSLITSIESVARKNINQEPNNEKLKEALYAMMNYGDAAADYFTSF